MSLASPELAPQAPAPMAAETVISADELNTFNQMTEGMDLHAPTPTVEQSPSASVIDTVKNLGIRAQVAVQSRQDVDGGVIERKLSGSKWGRAALRVGVVSVAATAFTLASRTASAYAHTKGVHLGLDDLHLSHSGGGNTVADAADTTTSGGNTAPQHHIETYGGRKIDTADYTDGDTTRTFENKDSLTGYAKDDLAVAMHGAGVDDKHIDDVLQDKHTVAYVVDGYHDDKDNKDIFGGKHHDTIKTGTEVSTDDARTRAAEVAEQANKLEDTFKPNEHMVATIDGHKIDLNDYTDNKVTAHHGASAWSNSEHDLLVAGKAHGLTDKQLDQVVTDRNVAHVTSDYINGNKDIKDHSKHWMMENHQYDATKAREHAQKIIEDYLDKHDDKKTDKTTTTGGHTTPDKSTDTNDHTHDSDTKDDDKKPTTPAPKASPSATPSATPSVSPSASASASASASPSASASASPSPSVSPSASASASASVSVSVSPSASASPSSTGVYEHYTPTPTMSEVPANRPDIYQRPLVPITPLETASPSASASVSPSESVSPSPSATTNESQPGNSDLIGS
jgi:hypothetical protein